MPLLGMRRGPALVMLAVGLVAGLGTMPAISVAATVTPGVGPPVAQPASGTGLPVAQLASPGALRLPTAGGCTPGSPLPTCPLTVPTTLATTASPASGPDAGQLDQGGGDADCGITDIGGCITNAINGFFRGMVTAALNPLLDLLSKTLLTTPTPDSLPRIGELWTTSWRILLACYALLVLVAGVLVMAYESLQTRHSIKEIAPRLVVGFLAGALSLWAATQAIEIANGLAQAVMGGGVDASSAGETLRDLVLGSLNGGIFVIFIGVFLAGMLVVLLVSYVVRVALTIILIVGAPLALMFHALPQTEGIARWWWKAFGGCLAIQVCQSLALITAMRVFLAPGGLTLFGPTASGLVNLLVALALLYILVKIPFWCLGSLRGGGRSLLGSVVRGFILYKGFGLLGGRGGDARRSRPSDDGGGRERHGDHGTRGGSGRGDGAADPYARSRADATGQYLLPLSGLQRRRASGQARSGPTPWPGQTAPSGPTARAAPGRRAPRGRQLTLPLGDDWPENKPVLGRDGQYRLPLNLTRVRPTARPHPGPAGAAGSSGRRRRAAGRQLELPFDPYEGNRPLRSGQYPLPLEGLRRVPPAPPAPRTAHLGAPAPPAAHPRTPSRASPPARQLRLPLDLPRPTRRAAPRRGGET